MTQMIDITAFDTFDTQIIPEVYRTARLSEFRAPVPKLLFGERLKEISALEASITKHGLMRPLKVTRSGDKYIVIDGRKRLCALRRMRYKNTLPRSLVNVPYVLSTEPVPHILSAQDLYAKVTRLQNRGRDQEDIIAALCLTDPQYRDLLCVNRLSPKLKSAFLNKTISLSQACAFAALPWYEAQDSLMLALGPSAAAHDILQAVKTHGGAIIQTDNRTVENRLDVNVIRMPSPPFTDKHFGLAA